MDIIKVANWRVTSNKIILKDDIKNMQISQQEKVGKLLGKLNDTATARIRNNIEVTFNKLK